MRAHSASPPITPLQTRKQEVVRSAIWDAAVDLFAATSFEETTIEEIARAAGVSTRTFFRYFASKADLMGQGMVRYRELLTEAVRGAPATFSPLEVVRHTVQQVAAQASAQPRTRQIVKIASSSVGAREAQLSRRAEVEDAVTEAFAARYRRDDIAPRLLTGLTLSIVDITFRVWSTREAAAVSSITDDVFDALSGIVSPGTRPTARKHSRH
jgi:TetR/AcrR family transcriptional regulator, regulator of mycofactocin system